MMQSCVSRKNSRATTTVFCALVLVFSVFAAPERIVFPNDASIVNVKTLGAAGNGTTDDTQALQRALDQSSAPTSGGHKLVYLPKGTYRVRQTLVVRSGSAGHGIGPWVYGEHRDSVIIKLDNGAMDSGAVLRTFANTPGSADWFMRTFHNFTIDVGNNPKVDGIQFYSNNAGILKDIRVRGSKGNCGIRSAYAMNGPNLIQDVIVEGFKIGIISEWLWGQTLSNITVNNCDSIGVLISANVVSAESLKISGTPVAVALTYPGTSSWWAGYVSLINCTFTGKVSTQPAIMNNGGMFYARNIKTTGFSRVVQGTGGASSINTQNIDELVTHSVRKLFPNSAERSLGLPIKREPRVPWETNLNNWVCANDYGAQPGDNIDDTQPIQSAIDAAAAAGKTVVYFRGGTGGLYNLRGQVFVHGSVRHVIGLGFARFIGLANTWPNNIGRFVMDNRSASAVKFQSLWVLAAGNPTFGFENRSSNTMVVESVEGGILGRGTGDVFVTNTPGYIHFTNSQQKLWARQLNPEGMHSLGLVYNSSSQLWILGLKTEGEGTMVQTLGGGRTEVLGAFFYNREVPATDTRPVFISDKSQFNFTTVREYTPSGKTAPIKVRETRNDTTRVLTVVNSTEWAERWACALYSGIPGIPATAVLPPRPFSYSPIRPSGDGEMVNMLGRRLVPVSQRSDQAAVIPGGVYLKPGEGKRIVNLPR